MASEIVKFEADDGQMVEFGEKEVRDLVCPEASPRDVSLFLAFCQAHKLDPIGAKDAYLVGFRDKKTGKFQASIITSYHVFNKIACSHNDYDGIESGIIVADRQGRITEVPGAAFFPNLGQTLLGGWARVYSKKRSHPFVVRVSLADYTTGWGNWKSRPAMMIEKVAKCQGWRGMYPEEMRDMYGAEEMDQAAPQSYEPLVVESVDTVRQSPAAETVQAPAEAAPSAPIDVYKLALIRARDERGVPVADSMARVREMIDKDPTAYDEADIAAVTIVDGLGQPEPEYEVVEEQLPLSDDDIPF